MTTRQPIAEGLISCRNILLGGRTNEHVLPCLQKVLVDLDSIAVSSTRMNRLGFRGEANSLAVGSRTNIFWQPSVRCCSAVRC